MRVREIRRSLVGRLRARRAEIEQAALTRVHSVSGTEDSDPEYLDGLRAAVSAALDYGIEALERSEDRPAPIPTALLSQARLAARHGVRLDTVLRRYLAGHTLLGDFLIEESGRGAPLNGESLKGMLRVQGVVLDRLIAAVSEEYAREAKARPGSAEQRLAQLVQRLLEGQRLDTSEVAYDFEALHQGAVAEGPGADEWLRGLAEALDLRILLLPRAEQVAWAWLAGRRPLEREELEQAISGVSPARPRLAFGEPGEGLGGWRLTHRQARAALPVARRSPEAFVRYADVALLAAILQDDLLHASLRQLYLAPLEGERDGGQVLRETLRAYLAAERNVTSAAAALGIKRHTVTNRLRVAEARISRRLDTCSAELEVALHLDELDTLRPSDA